jgi:hypothetical protein
LFVVHCLSIAIACGLRIKDRLRFKDWRSFHVLRQGKFLNNFYVAHQQGKAADPFEYFAAPENQDLGIVKQQRKPNIKLIITPFPDRRRNTDHFFFKASTSIPLTTAMQP